MFPFSLSLESEVGPAKHCSHITVAKRLEYIPEHKHSCCLPAHDGASGLKFGTLRGLRLSSEHHAWKHSTFWRQSNLWKYY